MMNRRVTSPLNLNRTLHRLWDMGFLGDVAYLEEAVFDPGQVLVKAYSCNTQAFEWRTVYWEWEEDDVW